MLKIVIILCAAFVADGLLFSSAKEKMLSEIFDMLPEALRCTKPCDADKPLCIGHGSFGRCYRVPTHIHEATAIFKQLLDNFAEIVTVISKLNE